MNEALEQSLAEVEALSRVVRIYMEALAEITCEKTSNPALHALTALRDASAIMEERTSRRPLVDELRDDGFLR